jgi:hypothetical protein
MLDFSKKDAHIVKASKKLADELLEMNTENRATKKAHMQWLQQAISDKHFILTPQGIGVSTEQKIIDGQHRLLAIKEAGYPPVELLIVTGLEPKSKIYVDQHAKRSTADMLKIVMNEEVTNRMASLVNCHLKISEDSEDGFIFRRKEDGRSLKPALDDIVDTMGEHISLLTLLQDAAGPYARAGILCALFHYATKYDAYSAIEFALQVRDGEKLTKNKPAYRLRQYLLEGGKRTSYGSSGQLSDYKNTVTACIKHAKGEEMESLRPSSSWDGLPEKLHPSRSVKKVA